MASLAIGSIPKQEIESLFNQKKYAIALENALNALHLEESKLPPDEKAFLLYYIGLSFARSNNKPMADIYLKRIISETPTSEYLKNVYWELGCLYENQFDIKEMYLSKLLEKYPDTTEAASAAIELSKYFLQYGNYRKTLLILEKIIYTWKKPEQYPDVYMLSAIAHINLKNNYDSIEFLKEVEKTAPDLVAFNPLYLFNAGKIYFLNLNYKKTILYFERLLNIFPSNINQLEAMTMLSSALQKDNRTLFAAVMWIGLLKASPQSQSRNTMHLELCKVLEKLNDGEMQNIQKNFPSYSNTIQMLQIVKTNSVIYSEKREALILISNHYKNKNNLAEALQTYQDFLKTRRDPLIEDFFKENVTQFIEQNSEKNNFTALLRFWISIKDNKSAITAKNLIKIADMLFDMHLLAQSESIYEFITKYRMYKEFWDRATLQLIRIYFQTEKFDKFFTSIKKVYTYEEPDCSELLYYQLETLKKTNHMDEYNTLLTSSGYKKIDNSFQLQISFLRADYFAASGNLTEARTVLFKALEFSILKPNDRIYIQTRIADFSYLLKDYDIALQYYTNAEKDNSNKEWLWFQQITILSKQGKFTEASVIKNKLVNEYPHSFWLSQLNKK